MICFRQEKERWREEEKEKGEEGKEGEERLDPRPN